MGGIDSEWGEGAERRQEEHRGRDGQRENRQGTEPAKYKDPYATPAAMARRRDRSSAMAIDRVVGRPVGLENSAQSQCRHGLVVPFLNVVPRPEQGAVGMRFDNLVASFHAVAIENVGVSTVRESQHGRLLPILLVDFLV